MTNKTFLPVITLLSATSLSALEVELRYDLDNGFFDNPEARTALQKVANFISELITDELGSIDPADFPPSPGEPPTFWQPTYLEPLNGGAVTAIPNTANLVVPENKLIVFVGGRPLTTSAQGGPGGVDSVSAEFSPFEWFNQVFNRGEPGALQRLPDNTFTTPTDLAPWGGTIFFDSQANWNFTQNEGSSVEENNFIPVALHEFFHVLGIGYVVGFTTSWGPLIQTGVFDGELAKASNGNNTLFLGEGGIHWWSGTAPSYSIGLFSQKHGTLQQALMEASSINTGFQFVVPTDLDLAALADIGWELAPNRGGNFQPEVAFSDTQASLLIPTNSGNDYIINRSSNLDDFAPSGQTIVGDGSIKTWNDPDPDAESGFFNVETIPNFVCRGLTTTSHTEKTKVKSIPGVHAAPTLPPAQEPHHHPHTHKHSHSHSH
ncbi:MAG: hypothetical protein AAGC74_08385 [Verrucomicrobiota bacterium]